MQNDGGAIYMKSQQMEIISSSFKSSYTNRGGALFLVASGTNAIVFINSCTFLDVHTGITSAVKGLGGAIFIDSTAAQSTVSVLRSNFLNVSAAVLGGVLYIDSGKYLTSITVDTCIIDSVFAVSGSLIYSSFIDQLYGKLKIQNSKVNSTRSTIDEYLGVIRLQNDPLAENFKHVSAIVKI